MAIRCDDAQEALSAWLDGEASPLPEPVVTGHLAACARCQAFQVDALQLGRGLRVHEARRAPATLAPHLALGLPAPAHTRRGWQDKAASLATRAVPGWAWGRPTWWAAAALPGVLACAAVYAGAAPQPHLVPSRPATPCTAGLRISAPPH